MSYYREKVNKKSRIYIHNDLANAAFHLKENVLRINDSKEAGIALHILGALTLYAFAMEAKINFLGSKTIENWTEGAPYHIKISKIIKSCNVNYEHNNRPLSTLNRLKNFRDLVAHGKPIEESESFERKVKRSSNEELELRVPAPHDEYCTLEYLLEVAEDIDIFWNESLQGAGIEFFETVTRFSGDTQYLGEVTET